MTDAFNQQLRKAAIPLNSQLREKVGELKQLLRERTTDVRVAQENREDLIDMLGRLERALGIATTQFHRYNNPNAPAGPMLPEKNATMFSSATTKDRAETRLATSMIA